MSKYPLLFLLVSLPGISFAKETPLPQSFHPQEEIQAICGELGSLGYESAELLQESGPELAKVKIVEAHLLKKYSIFPSYVVRSVMLSYIKKDLPDPLNFSIALRETCLETLDESVES